MRYLCIIFFIGFNTLFSQTEIKEYIRNTNSYKLVGANMGIIDFEDNILLDIKYSKIVYESKEKAKVTVSDKKAFLKKYASIIIDSGTYGNTVIIDLNGKIANDILDSKTIKCPCPKKAANGKYGFVNKDGNFVIKPVYDKAGRFYNGFSIITLGNLKGYLSEDGEIIKPQFRLANPFHDGIALILTSDSNKYRYINKKGEFIEQDNSLTQRSFFNDGIGLAKKDNKYVLIDTNGNITETNYDYISSFREGYAYARIDHKEGLIDKKGNIILPMKFNSLSLVNNGKLIFYEKGKYGLINIKGEILIEAKYDELEFLGKNYLKARIGGHLIGAIVREKGAFNTKGQRVGLWEIEEKYDKSIHKGEFINGLKHGKWNVYINNKLIRIENYKYDEKDGYFYYYSSNGKLNRKEYFVNGYYVKKRPEIVEEDVIESVEIGN